MYKYTGIAILLFSVVGCQQDPKSYADCILKYVKSNQVRDAVAVIHRACREKFPKKENYFNQFDDPEPATGNETTKMPDSQYTLGDPVDYDPFENSRLNEDGAPKNGYTLHPITDEEAKNLGLIND